jgi:hypothetical protein
MRHEHFFNYESEKKHLFFIQKGLLHNIFEVQVVVFHPCPQNHLFFQCYSAIDLITSFGIVQQNNYSNRKMATDVKEYFVDKKGSKIGAKIWSFLGKEKASEYLMVLLGELVFNDEALRLTI